MKPVTVQEVLKVLRGSNGNSNPTYRNPCADLADRIEAHGIAPPDGYVLVPVVPTAEIINAVLSVITDCHSAAESYGDILEAAAPKQEND